MDDENMNDKKEKTSVDDYKPDPNMRGFVSRCPCKCGRMMLIETAYNGTVSMGNVFTPVDELNELQKEAIKKYYGINLEEYK
jgi:hypothetical protein